MRIFCLLVITLCSIAHAAPIDDETRLLVIIVDGLRPDYVTPELTPRLHAAAQEGVFCEHHHSVFPTVTRVNSATFGTGMYPKNHGIMGNSIYIPSVDERKPLNTSSRGNLLKVLEAEGELLTAPTLGELLQAKGMEMLACSAGSAGSAFLMNANGAGAGIIHYNFTVPQSRQAEVVAKLGPEPEDALPSDERNAYAADALIEFGLKGSNPKVTYIWFTDPDHTAHAKGMGDPLTNESIRLVDGHIGRILDAYEAEGVPVNVFVTSDHGFSTHAGGANVVGPLMQANLKRSPSSDDIVIAGGAIYVRDGGPEKVVEVANVLMAEKAIGPIFSRAESPGSHLGVVPGTLSFELIHWNHPRGADLLVSARWTDEKNEHGYEGHTTNNGVAGHGSASPWDIHNTLVAFGPDIKQGARNPLPTGNVDIAPTMAYLAGLDAYENMDGRPLRELLREGPEFDDLKVTTNSHIVEGPDGSYNMRAIFSVVENKRYFDFAQVQRR